MTYVPSGFWPRLVSRFLTCATFVGVVLRALGHTEEEVRERVSRVATGETSKAVGLEWTYWKTGIELWYKGLSLLRVTEILTEGIFDKCEPSPSIFEQSRTVPIKPSEAVQDLSFELNNQWMPVHSPQTPNHGIEILVPDTVCPAVLRREMEEEGERERERERVWMSAGLLTQAVDFIDTLLEDWYPGLGAREGNTTVDSIPYVNRVIPCPFCVNGACVSDPVDERIGREASPPSPHTPHNRSSNSPSPAPRETRFSPGTTPPQPPVFFLSGSHHTGGTPDYSDLDHSPSQRRRCRPVKTSRSPRPCSPLSSRQVSRESPHSADNTPPSSVKGRGTGDQTRGRSLSSPHSRRLRDILGSPRHRSQENLPENTNEGQYSLLVYSQYTSSGYSQYTSSGYFQYINSGYSQYTSSGYHQYTVCISISLSSGANSR